MRGAFSFLLAVLLLASAPGTALAAAVSPPVAATPTPLLADAAGSPGTSVTSMGAQWNAANGSVPPDPSHDAVGWVDGYWYNQTIQVDQRDGLSKPELHAFVSRAEARVEYITHRNFKHTVPVEVLSRAEYRNQSHRGSVSPNQTRWNDQVWRALFIIGNGDNVTRELHSFYGAQVEGYYSPARDKIVIITETPNRPVIDNATLIHELTHALQDQYYDIGSARYQGVTQDGELARQGLLEGEANYVRARYDQRCRSGWQCVATPPQNDGGGSAALNFGIQTVLYQPYAVGPGYVYSLVQHGGWGAVDTAFQHPPNTSAQVIHRVQPGNEGSPPPIAFSNTARNGWHLFPDQGRNGSDTVGEASIYAMFWYQSYRYQINAVDWQTLYRPSRPYDQFNYVSTPSAGWANDRIYPYQLGQTDQYGYVWVTKWVDESNASQFDAAYRTVLSGHHAKRVAPSTWVVGSGPYAGAYRVVQDGTTVTIVNAPSVAALSNVHPTGAANATGSNGDTGGATSSEASSTSTPAPGFGVSSFLVAVFALVVIAAFVARSSRR